MAENNEVFILHKGKQYGATFSMHNGMLSVKTHTETRSLEVGDADPATLARRVLTEIVQAQIND